MPLKRLTGFAPMFTGLKPGANGRSARKRAAPWRQTQEDARKMQVAMKLKSEEDARLTL
jgi:hypothetical protein